MIALKKNQVYTGVGQTMARCFVVHETLQKSPKGQKHLLILEDQKACKLYQKYFQVLFSRHISNLNSQADLYKFSATDSGIFVSSLDVFYQDLPDQKELDDQIFRFEVGQKLDYEAMVNWLADHGFHHSETPNRWTYSKEGDVLSLCVGGAETVVKVSFFGSQIDGIYVHAVDNPGEIEEHTSYSVVGKQVRGAATSAFEIQTDFSTGFLSSYSQVQYWFIGLDFFEHLDDLLQNAKEYYHIADLKTQKCKVLDFQSVDIADIQGFRDFLSAHEDIDFYTRNGRSLKKFLHENNFKNFKIHDIGALTGESFSAEKKHIVCDDILSRIFIKKRTRKRAKYHLDLLIQIKPGDYVVHLYHGVGKFLSIIKKDLSGRVREYLEIEYAQEDKLFVPIEEVYRVSKYVGADNPKLTRLGKIEWKKTLVQTEKEVEDIAEKLLDIHAKRQVAKGFSFHAFPEKEHVFHDSFEHVHTSDQETAIEEILEDMEKPVPMDRLLTGDVGFGKTEVAMQALYRAFLNGKQSILLTPLVVLAYEHLESCIDRLHPFGVKIAILSRLSSAKEVRSTLKGLKEGSIHVVIGTHRLLSPDVEYANLGLLIMDEEHKFGVKDKEKIQSIKSGIDTLSMSATPIPRSLNLALSGVKQISTLATAPYGKRPIPTVVSQYQPEIVKNAFDAEIERGGKMFYIFNRVETIDSMKQMLEKTLGKKAKIIVTHGQMSGVELEDRIMEFKTGDYNILLSTTVIENGINFLDTNTIVIHDAHRFGLSQLHQLRGRVGRGKIHGFCYLMYSGSDLADDAKKRLVTIANNTHMGAGFEIAMKDMEIRGAGEILGVKQSGKTKEVGVSFYLKLLEQKVSELQAGAKPKLPDCKIDLDISFYIPDEFFDSDMDKIHFFRSLESVESVDDLEFTYEKIMEDKDSEPVELKNLFLLLKAKLLFQSWGIIEMKKQMGDYIFQFRKDNDQKAMRKFLDADHDRNIVLISMNKAKIPEKRFASDIMLLEYFIGK